MSGCGRLSSDRISNLPSDATDSILAFLPIRDAIRTSILSTKWKDRWVRLPHLIFKEDTFEGAFPHSDVSMVTDDVIKAISQVLLQHNGPVLKFLLSISHMRTCPDIDHWLSFLSRNGIEELTLDIQTPQLHKLQSSFFSCQHLVSVKLSNCILRPPPTFGGFKNLRHIDFRRVSCSAASLENFIANSPLLKKLSLHHMLDLHKLNINAPNLECLSFTGITPNHLPNAFSLLWHIKLYNFSLGDLNSVACALCLIKNSPYLQEIWMYIKTPVNVSADIESVLTFLKVN